MKRRIALVTLLSPALAACSYHYELKAIAVNGRIAFVPVDEKSSGCLSDVTVTDGSGKVIWQLDAGRYIPPPCVDRFPLTYGLVPPDVTEKVKALPLREGTTYTVEAWDGDRYSGRFRFRKAVVIDNLGK